MKFTAVLCALAASAVAKPLVVDLETAWHARPHVLEVLETIFQHNGTAYYPLLSLYLSRQESSGDLNSDEAAARFLFSEAQKGGFLTDARTAIAQAQLASNDRAAFIEAQYQYFEQQFVTKVGSELLECDNVLWYGGKASCDPTEVFTLETNVAQNVDLQELGITESEKIIGGGDGDVPTAVLYGDVLSADFPTFHAHLLASAVSGKLNYVLRYKPSNELASIADKVGGYNAYAQVKRTDYLVVDDRPVKESANSAELRLDLNAPNKVAKEDIPQLPLKAASYILQAKDSFAALVDTVLNFPSHFADFGAVKIEQALVDNGDANRVSGYFAPGSNLLLINGAPISLSGDDNSAYTLLKALSEEVDLVEGLEGADLSTEDALELLTSDLLLRADPGEASVKRYDYRSNAISWLNDLETGAQYSDWPEELEALTEPADPGNPLIPLRRNTNNLVVALELNNLNSIKVLGQLFQILARGAPLRIGVVPLDQTTITQYFLEVGHEGGFHARQAYVVALLQGMNPEEARDAALRQISGAPISRISGQSAVPEKVFTSIQTWKRRLGIEAFSVLANGVFIPGEDNWLYDAFNNLLKDQEKLVELIGDGTIDESDGTINIEKLILKGAPRVRDPLTHPFNAQDVTYVSTQTLHTELYGFRSYWPASNVRNDSHSLWVIADFTEKAGFEQLVNALNITMERGVSIYAVPVLNPAKFDDPSYIEFINFVIGLQSHPSVFAMKSFEALRPFILEGGGKPKVLREGKQYATLDELLEFLPAVISKVFNDQTPPANSVIADGRIIVSPKRALDSSQLIGILDNEAPRVTALAEWLKSKNAPAEAWDFLISLTTLKWNDPQRPRLYTKPWNGEGTSIEITAPSAKVTVDAIIDPASEQGQQFVAHLQLVKDLGLANIRIYLSPKDLAEDGPLPNRYLKSAAFARPQYDTEGALVPPSVSFDKLGEDVLYVVGIDEPNAWVVMTKRSDYDLDNVILNTVDEPELRATYELRSLLLEGFARDVTGKSPRGVQLNLGSNAHPQLADTLVMQNLGYYQFQTKPGYWDVSLKQGPSADIYNFFENGNRGSAVKVWVTEMTGKALFPLLARKPGKEDADVLEHVGKTEKKKSGSLFGKLGSSLGFGKENDALTADINIFTVASGHLYERFLSLMTLSVMKHTKHTVKFWLIENFLSPSFKEFLPTLAKEYKFDYELVTYKWPSWLRGQAEKQREIWGYKILFLDTLFPQSLDKVIFVDSDQIVRTDMQELVDEDLHGAPYGYTPMGDDREETEGFRFWKQGYWEKVLGDKPYHISALYVVDLNRFRELGAGDILRQHYQQLSADPGSLSNLDQDLPNNLQKLVPIHSLHKDWLWCETWCADEGLATAKTIDLCNNPLTKEPKLDRARRQIPEWTTYDDAVAELRARHFATAAAAKEAEAPIRKAPSPVDDEQTPIGREIQEDPLDDADDKVDHAEL